MAIELGSDVPVCLYSRPSWVEGAGEKIRPVEVAISLWVILINPRITLLTGDVFNAFSGKYTTQMPLFNTIATPELLLEQLQMTHNSLQPTACALAPEISVVLAAIAALPGCQMARMSGSGATCFGLFLTQAEAVQAKQQLHAVHPQWWCVATPLWESDRETQ
jgi:4-diphosphocytidyl-2-C-methyl-D-erythritol kinase